MEASGYELHLYCDVCPPDWRQSQSFYAGATRGDCLKQAKKDGWVYRADGTHACHKCKQQRRTPPPVNTSLTTPLVPSRSIVVSRHLGDTDESA